MASPVSAVQVVKVGVYHFPPFMVVRGTQSSSTDQVQAASGVIIEMLQAMNAFQDEYHFETFITSPRRRFTDFREGMYDVSMFDSLAWGWEGLPVEATNVFLRGGEVYIAQSKPGRGQEFFSSFEDKRMIGVLGYHYGFAAFNADSDYLRKKFKMQLTPSNLGSIRMILAGNRGDIAVVTKSFLAQYLGNHPEHRDELLISERMDQEYHHTIIVRKGVSPGAGELNSLLESMRQAGKLQPLWQSISIDE